MAPEARLETNGSIERRTPALDKLLAPDARLEKVAGGFSFTEGPIWDHRGFLLFSDIPRNRIMKWTPEGSVSVFMEPSGYRGSRKFSGYEPGSNGLTLDPEGRLTIAEHGGRRVTRLESDGSLTVLAETYDGKRLNSPNDLVYGSDGALYFTDPPYGLETQENSDPYKELAHNGVYRIADAVAQPAGAPCDTGKLELLFTGLDRPNGLAFSPDEHWLYLGNSHTPKVILRFEVGSRERLGEPEVFFDVTSSPEPGAPDGMKVDVAGNLWATGPGGVWIFSPEGAHLGTVHTPEGPANCHWGDADGKALYITAHTSVYRIRTETTGIRP